MLKQIDNRITDKLNEFFFKPGILHTTMTGVCAHLYRNQSWTKEDLGSNDPALRIGNYWERRIKTAVLHVIPVVSRLEKIDNSVLCINSVHYKAALECKDVWLDDFFIQAMCYLPKGVIMLRYEGTKVIQDNGGIVSHVHITIGVNGYDFIGPQHPTNKELQAHNWRQHGTN